MAQIVGQFCMDMAIAKAKQVGVAWVNCVGEYTVQHHVIHV